MSEKQGWTSEEDRLLKQVYDSGQAGKWSEVAKILQEEYGIKGRTSKQCK